MRLFFCTAKAHPFYADNGHFRHEEVCCSRLRSGFFTVYIENATFAMILTKIHMENKKICGRIETELRSNKTKTGGYHYAFTGQRTEKQRTVGEG